MLKLRYQSRLGSCPKTVETRDVFVWEIQYMDTLISVQISLYSAKSTKSNIFLPNSFLPVIMLLSLFEIRREAMFILFLKGEIKEGYLCETKYPTSLSIVLQSVSFLAPKLNANLFLSEGPHYILPHINLSKYCLLLSQPKQGLHSEGADMFTFL